MLRGHYPEDNEVKSRLERELGVIMFHFLKGA